MADYVDFYSSEQHARNVSAIFRPDSPGPARELEAPADRVPRALGNRGRQRHRDRPTVAVSASRARRPNPRSDRRRRLDIEAEVGFVVGVPSALGTQVTPATLADHVFGVVLVNDWSARDIQAWEYVPLGPFLGKSFGTSVSPWVVPLDALARARCPLRHRTLPCFDYLHDDDPWCLDLRLTVGLNGSRSSASRRSRPSTGHPGSSWPT